MSSNSKGKNQKKKSVKLETVKPELLLSPPVPSFQCNICKLPFDEQFEFFEHLRSHYDKNNTTISKSPKSPGASDVSKRKPVVIPISSSIKTNLRSYSKAKALSKIRNVVKQNKVPKKKVVAVLEPELIVPTRAETPDSDSPAQQVPDDGLESDHLESDPPDPPIEEPESQSITTSKTQNYTCHHCFDSFSSKRQKVLHIKQEHKEESKDGQICAICGTTVQNLKQLNVHMRKEHPNTTSPTSNNPLSKDENPEGGTSKVLECKECSKTFVHKNSLIYHMKKHTGERPYVCDECGKTFLASSALSVHKRLHTGERPFACEHCDKRFRQWGDLAYHKVSIHSNVKAFTCEFCTKNFARKYSLTVHRRIHTGEKGYNCDLCEKSFRASSYLQNHRRIHTGERPHNCDICLKPFRVKSDMKRHRLSHSRTRVTPNLKTKSFKAPADPLTQIRLEEVEKETNGTEIISEETVHHNLVAVDASGQIIPLEPKIAQQLRAGQVIQVPVTNSIIHPTLTTGVDNQGIITYFSGGESFQEDPPDASNTIEVKQDISLYQPTSIIVTSGGEGDEANSQGIILWPNFMS